MNVKELCDAFYSYQKNKVKNTTLYTYVQRRKYFKLIEDIKLHELTVEDYKVWRNCLDDSKLSTAYKNDILKFFKELLKYAERWYGYDFRDLYNKFDKFRDPNAIIDEGINYYTYEEFKKFISVETDLKYKVAFELLYFCGLRRGKLLALTWKHINFDTNELSVKQNLVENRLEGGYLITSPKTRSSIRTIPLFNKLIEDLKALKPDIMITCAFGQILSEEILNIPKLGVINIHASLLPEYRGASPIHYAILDGKNKTGITIMKTDVGIDTGDIILQKEIDINDDETCGELFDRLSVLGAQCIIEALPNIINGSAKYIKQEESRATLTKIIKKEMAKIEWNNSADKIYNQIRAFNPAPVAFATFQGQPFKIYSAKVVSISGEPGKVIKADDELIVGCGEKSLSLVKVQKAGGKPMDIKDFLRGNKLSVGEDFI